MNFETLKILNPLDSSYQLTDSKLIIQTDGGYMWGIDNRCHNLCVAPQAAESCTAELDLNILPKTNGEQAGLILLIDADNYIKFVREMVDDQQVVVLAKELDGNPNVELKEPFSPADLTLKIEHRADQITVFWKGKDDAVFQQQSFPNWFPSGAIYRPGLLVHGSNPSNQAVFHSFSVSD
ncbi:MAG: hypothetical protein AAF902_07425 [Chloroflexota bacterium]